MVVMWTIFHFNFLCAMVIPRNYVLMLLTVTLIVSFVVCQIAVFISDSEIAYVNIKNQCCIILSKEYFNVVTLQLLQF